MDMIKVLLDIHNGALNGCYYYVYHNEEIILYVQDENETLGSVIGKLRYSRAKKIILSYPGNAWALLDREKCELILYNKILALIPKGMFI
jgi:hypothetical protein